MSISYFNQLQLKQRLYMVINFGERIYTLTFRDFKVSLYALDGCLIEVYYNTQTDTIEDIVTLTGTESRLQLYTMDVNIQGLFS